MTTSFACRVLPSRSRRRLGFTLPVVVALIFGAGPLPARAELHFVEPVANVGVIYAGTPLVHEFAFANAGPETVTILAARASCGCLKPRLAQSAYRPGEDGSVLLEVNTLSQAPGAHTWTVTVSYQTGNTSQETQVRLSARIVSEVTVQPATLIVFADKLAQHELTLIDSRSRPLEVIDLRASSPKLFPRIAEAIRDERGQSRRKIRLAVADDYPDGRHEEILDIYTDDARYRQLRVPVTIIKRAQQRLLATPSQIELVAPAGQPFPSRIVLIRDEQGQAVHIDQILSDSSAIACQWAPGPGSMATLRVRANASLIPDDGLQSAIHVYIDQPTRETLTILVRCTVR
jgi:hypothetical protein